jgi:sensor histidine kinase regulating citrate/malate metabolism
MTTIAIEILDEILLSVGFMIESTVDMIINFTNSFMYFFLGIMALGMMYAMFLMFDIKRMEKQRLLRK